MLTLSLNAIHTNIMVFSPSIQRAIHKMNELAETLNEEIVRRTKDSIETKSGKKILARRWSDSCRGYRYQDVYVDYSLKYEEAMDHIIAKLVPPHYYSDVKADENYRWQDHVHYF
jgi:hypothetical protein